MSKISRLDFSIGLKSKKNFEINYKIIRELLGCKFHQLPIKDKKEIIIKYFNDCRDLDNKSSIINILNLATNIQGWSVSWNIGDKYDIKINEQGLWESITTPLNYDSNITLDLVNSTFNRLFIDNIKEKVKKI